MHADASPHVGQQKLLVKMDGKLLSKKYHAQVHCVQCMDSVCTVFPR